MNSEKAKSMPASDHNTLPHADDDGIGVLSASDRACLEQLGSVLAKRDKTGRFGVVLRHRHFDLEEGEIFAELCDEDARILTTLPVREEDLSSVELMDTSWYFTESSDLVADKTCETNPKTGIHKKLVRKHSS